MAENPKLHGSAPEGVKMTENDNIMISCFLTWVEIQEKKEKSASK